MSDIFILTPYIMSKTHAIYVPTTGKNTKKFIEIAAFEKKTGKKLYKKVVGGFRMAGKVAAFIRKNTIAVWREGYNYNGYGYQDHDYYYLMRPTDAKIVQEMLEERSRKHKEAPTYEQKKEAWCRRLAKLTGITVEVATEIAEEKLDAKKRQIDKLMDRQYNDHYSVRREKLINELIRSNPLRRIEDADHARSILAASVRHNFSNYDDLLEEASNKAAWGEINYSEVKDYARMNANYNKNVEEVFFNKGEDVNVEEDVRMDEVKKDSSAPRRLAL